jgi:hypothetical protein
MTSPIVIAASREPVLTEETAHALGLAVPAYTIRLPGVHHGGTP